MNKKPIPPYNDKPFLVRAKLMDMSNTEFDKKKMDNNHLLIKDTRGNIFKLASVAGEFFKSKKRNEEFPIIMHVQERQDGDFDYLNIVSQIHNIHTKSDDNSDIPKEATGT